MANIRNEPNLFWDSGDEIVVDWDISEWQAELGLGELRLKRIKKVKQ